MLLVDRATDIDDGRDTMTRKKSGKPVAAEGDHPDEPVGPDRLRWLAEEAFQREGASWSGKPEDALKLIHELRVHQIELQMQNEQLRQVQAELEAVRERYFDLYNLAPVGYFIVSHDGRFLEANLTGVELLGVARAELIRQPISRFIFEEDQDVYYHHRQKLLATGKAHTCELRMVKNDGTVFWTRLTATDTQEPSSTRIVVSDISEQKRIEQEKAALAAQIQTEKRRARK